MTLRYSTTINQHVGDKLGRPEYVLCEIVTEAGDYEAKAYEIGRKAKRSTRWLASLDRTLKG